VSVTYIIVVSELPAQHGRWRLWTVRSRVLRQC